MFFKKKQPVAPVRSPDAVTHVVEPSLPINKKVLSAFSLRQGMWVMTQHGVGIVRDAQHNPPAVDVVLVNPDGTNRLEIVLPPSEVTQARLSDIPEPRRPHQDSGARKGYF